MRSYGEDIGNQRIVQKLLISLPRSYDSIAPVIENTKDLEIVNAQDVVAILKGYEQRIDRHVDNQTEKAFASLNVAPTDNRYNGNQNFKPQKNWKSKGKKWVNKPTNQAGKAGGTSDGAKNSCKYCDKLHFGECWFKNKPRCHNCKKLDHIAKDCNGKKDKGNQHYIDSGCSNHMTGKEDLLVDIDKSITAKVEMGTGQLVDVTRKGHLLVETKQGKRYIKEARSEDDMRCTSGYAFSFGSGIFSWTSMKQCSVALSTAEAEYASVAEAMA
ncbi:uncharacterized protein LOC125478491 [Pyrus x bretschneideri]|uniref:uncharacterized protein LOC125478491 n=1 Tax=Pyrus x bretschneideri TaxID=225117 RepID=UPI00202EB5AF|nr:uncharacterized protein LOC125478491 [Pyrus x bretschneideri]